MTDLWMLLPSTVSCAETCSSSIIAVYFPKSSGKQSFIISLAIRPCFKI